MGGIIQATPLLRTLRQNYPNAKLLFVTSRSNKALLDRIAFINYTVFIDDSSIFALVTTTIRALIFLWRIRLDLYIDLEVYSHLSSVLTLLSLAQHRIGYFKRSFSYSHGIYTHMVYFNIRAPIHHVYLQLARLIGCACIDRRLAEFPVSQEDRTALKDTLGKAGISLARSLVVMNPNASDLRVERRWSGTDFATLAHKILSAFDRVDLVFTGVRGEHPYTKSICDQIASHARCFNLCGALSLGELCALLDESLLMITNDSGPLHLAAARKRPIVALFGPCSPNQYGHLDGVIPVYKNVYCSPCVHEFDVPPCKGDNACMKAISVEEVFAVVQAVLSGQADSRIANIPEIGYVHCVTSRPLGIVER
jgi:ADP-heptose:LPS heptosyltransferase